MLLNAGFIVIDYCIFDRILPKRRTGGVGHGKMIFLASWQAFPRIWVDQDNWDSIQEGGKHGSEKVE